MTANKFQRYRRNAIALVGFLVLLVLFAVGTPTVSAAEPEVRIPDRAAMYRLWVNAAASEVFGVDAPEARLAAQLHQESAWKTKARSQVGAQGMAQFMPATAKWIAEMFPDQLGRFDPWDPRQAILAAAIYDRYLHDRVQPIGTTPLSPCTRWAFALRGYNGGETWLTRERNLAAANGADPNDWTAVAKWRRRGVAAHKENTHYPRRILLELEPAYRAAGWPGRAVC